MKDLYAFMIFFIIILLYLSLMLGVVKLNDAETYESLNPITANYLTMLRFSLGDFSDLEMLTGLSPGEKILFWAVFLISVFVAALIFLNFVIAEVGNTYSDIRQNVEAKILKERAGLINEADLMSLSKILG